MIQLPPAFGLPVSVSPYCTKVELYFRLTDREYQTTSDGLRRSPNGKVPYVRWADGTRLAESDDIIARFEQEGPSLDAGLDEADRRVGTRLAESVERVLYYACLYARFGDAGGWAHQKGTVRGLVPWILSPILVPIIRRSQIKLCAENGFEDDSGYESASVVIDEVAATLGDRPFLLGDTPRTADCAVWANVMQTAYTKAPNPGRERVRGDERLMAYVARLAERARLTLPALS